MSDFDTNKQLVLNYFRELDAASGNDIGEVIQKYTGEGYHWRGVHPFHEQYSADAVAGVFWKPFRRSFTTIQRRQDVLIAGLNDVDGSETEWVCSMGHLMGLFDRNWLGLPASGKLAFLRYAEFNRITDGKISESAFFCDIISVMQQVGLNPLPLQTGASFLTPGPRTHDGLLYEAQDPSESAKTLALMKQLIEDLTSSYDDSPEERLGRSWHDDMAWFGPAGIGATYTRERYRKQHQGPFRQSLEDIRFNGHICCIAEGNYGGFFGWPNLSMKAGAGFMGLPASERQTEMRVVDIYRREGDKLAENWVFIDLLHYLSLQGLDLLGRMQTILRT